DLASAERRLVLENTSAFWSFDFDWQLNPRLGRVSTSGRPGSCLYRLFDGKSEPWLYIPHADEMTTWPLTFNRAGHKFTMMSSLGRDRAVLVRVDADSGAETLLAEHDKADIGVWRIWNPVSFEIDAIGANYRRQEWIALDPKIAGDLEFLRANLRRADEFAV